ncbi:MAG: hypothetical protein JSU70_13475 [Phycisphaerales bacterium]|nr:MAG: hypothetical protein JSU70_13475 [Phycisphaerales bacterium]
MCGLFSAIAFAAFWLFVVRLWVFRDRKTALVFVGLWSLGLVGAAIAGAGWYVFMGLEAVLAPAMMVIAGYKGFL